MFLILEDNLKVLYVIRKIHDLVDFHYNMDRVIKA